MMMERDEMDNDERRQQANSNKKKTPMVIARERQISKLTLIYPAGNPKSPIPRNVFLYGQSGTGKSTVLNSLCSNHFINDGMYSVARVDCLECFTPRLLFDCILGQWFGQEMVESRCDSFASFVTAIKANCSEATGSVRKLLVILDRCECMRDSMPMVLSSFLRLSEILNYESNSGGAKIISSAILVSNIVWDRFRSPSAVSEPLFVHFPDYTKDEIFSILREKHEGVNVKLFDAFLLLLQSIFHASCKDLNEYMYLTSLLYPIYIRPIELGQCSETDSGRLFRHIEGYFKDCLSKLYLRELSQSEWKRASCGASSSNSSSSENFKFELPIISKYLVLASYLASYNPAKQDVRLFGNNNGVSGAEKKQRPRKTNTLTSIVAQAKKSKATSTSHLTGPKPFPLERMLAIFYNLIPDPVPPTVDINMQISTLISRRLILRSSPMDKLDAVRLKCNVSLDFIVKLGKTVNVDINKYLFHFI